MVLGAEGLMRGMGVQLFTHESFTPVERGGIDVDGGGENDSCFVNYFCFRGLVFFSAYVSLFETSSLQDLKTGILPITLMFYRKHAS